jgi:hypothetical protein
MVTREYPYGMLSSMIAYLQNNASTYADNRTTTFSPYNTCLASRFALSNPGRNAQPSLNTTSLMSLRHQMDENNHDVVNPIKQQLCTMSNPLIQNTNQCYQMLATQMDRIADFYGNHLVQNQQIIFLLYKGDSSSSSRHNSFSHTLRDIQPHFLH